jgi:hypothetical protein
VKTVRCAEIPSAYGKRSRCRAAKRRHIAEFGIGDHHGERQAGGAELTHQPQCLSPLRVEGDGRGNPCGRAPLPRQPLLGQIQHGAEKPGAHARPQRGRDRHLAIRNLAERSA